MLPFNESLVFKITKETDYPIQISYSVWQEIYNLHVHILYHYFVLHVT